MRTPFARSAQASASADLPEAVGPAMRPRGGRPLLIATLIAAGTLSQERINEALRLLASARVDAETWSWLDEGDAADILVEEAPERMQEIRLPLERELKGIDVVVQPSEHRLKRLLVADMDSTM